MAQRLHIGRQEAFKKTQKTLSQKAVGQASMNASQYTASPRARSKPTVKHSEGTGFIRLVKNTAANILRY